MESLDDVAKKTEKIMIMARSSAGRLFTEDYINKHPELVVQYAKNMILLDGIQTLDNSLDNINNRLSYLAVPKGD